MPTDRRVISETTPAAASTVASTQVWERLDEFDGGMIVASLVGATGGTLDIYLQTEGKAGDWNDYLHFAQLSAGAAAIVKVCPVTRTSQRLATVTAGKNGTPALAVDTCVGGDFGARIRALYVAGVGTSAGAAVVLEFLGTKLTR